MIPNGLLFLCPLLLGVCQASEEVELKNLLAELQTLAEHQKQQIDAYEAAVSEKLKDTNRRLQSASIFEGPQLLPNRRSYTFQESAQGTITHAWLLLCGALVMFMQSGLAMCEVGYCRVRSSNTILVKNLTAVAASAYGWWIFGWSFAFSGPLGTAGFKDNRFGGREQFLGHHFVIARPDGQMEPTDRIVYWFFTWTFCSVATVISTMGVAERLPFLGSVIFSALFSSFIYPFPAAWSWGRGFLADMNDTGFVDFAGSGIVFMAGGFVSLVGSFIAGPRPGRWDEIAKADRLNKWPRAFQPHSMPLAVMGSFIIWFSWYGMACGSTYSMRDNERGMLAAQVAMNGTLAAACGGITAFALRGYVSRKYDIGMFCNGILAGLASISAGCSTVEYGSAVAIGVLGGLLYAGTAMGMRMLGKADDPVEAFAVYGMPGLWGVIAASIFDWGNGFSYAHGRAGFRCIPDLNGVCKDGIGAHLVAANFSLIAVVLLWTGALSGIIFFGLKAGKVLGETPVKPKTDTDGTVDVLEVPGTAGSSNFRYEDVVGSI